MADYNRFISYIYLYERGMKTMNTGFAKVESRSGQCRVSITMKNMYHESHVKFSVYMFVRKEKRLLGIFLGELQTENSAGTFNGVTDAENIQGSGYGLDDVRGMIIRGDNGKLYGTGWDDEALDVSRFAPLSREGEEAFEKEEPSRAAEVPSQTGNEGFSDGSEADREEVLTPERAADVVSERVPEPDQMEDDPVVSELMKNGASYADPDLPQKLDSTVSVEDLKGLNLKAESMEMAKMPMTGDFEEAKARQPQASGLTALEKIIDQGMRMFPFEDNEMAACVCMEPQDIGLLPMPYWRLAGNSFLLHGYYSYRHLIMARKKDGTFVFCVPGIDDERERFMAEMFGFPGFKPVRAHAAGPGQFGYWYMELEEPLDETRSVV